MKIAIAAVTAAYTLLACQSPPEHEASMNFDLENVQPFLADLDRSLELGMDVGELAALTRSVGVDEEASIELSVQYSGESSTVRLTVFMDDHDAPDIYFFSPNIELINAIRTEMIEFAENRGL